MSQDDDVLDAPCPDELEYAVSEGGDSLLDSEDEKPPTPPCPLPSVSDEQRRSSFQPPPCLVVSPSSSKSPLPLPNDLLSRCRDCSGKPKVIRLDRRRKLRYVSDSLPAVLLPKRVRSQKDPFIRHRRLSKPSLLLQLGKGWMAGPKTDCRHILEAKRVASLRQIRGESTAKEESCQHSKMSQTAPLVSGQSFDLWSGAVSSNASHARVFGLTRAPSPTSTIHTPLPSSDCGTTSSGLQQIIGRPSSPSSSPGHPNPFLSRMKQHSEPAHSHSANPFFSALQKEELLQTSAATLGEPSTQDSFSFSLTQFTR